MHYGKQVLIDCFLAIYLYLAACNPADVQIADDGMPFLAERNSYMPLSDDIRAATPFDHIAFDYQPCGHPPLGIFTKPHYDLHIYHVPVKAREHMTCDLLPGAPVCAFPADAQTSDSGKAFYDQIPTIAKNFAVGIDTAIPLSGIHYWNQDTQPASAAEWTEPFFIMGGVSFHSNAVLSWSILQQPNINSLYEMRMYLVYLCFNSDLFAFISALSTVALSSSPSL